MEAPTQNPDLVQKFRMLSSGERLRLINDTRRKILQDADAISDEEMAEVVALMRAARMESVAEAGKRGASTKKKEDAEAAAAGARMSNLFSKFNKKLS